MKGNEGDQPPLSRRAILVGASLAAALPFAPLRAQYIEPTSNAEKFMYATVRIVGKNASGEDAGGTGFFYKINLPNKEWTVILITNKHVVSDIATGANIDVHTRSPSASRPDGIDNIRLDKAQWVDHPDRDIDLCAYPIQQNFNELKSPVFILTLDKSIIPSNKMLEDLDAIEEVVMIGYPVLLHDSKNRYPLMRRGVTASHPAVNFDGRSKTALDIAVFPGSSGSPVLIYNMGSYFNKPQGAITPGSRILLLGVLYEGSTINTKGKIEIQQAPTLLNPAPSAISGNWQMSAMMNVGYIVKSAEIQPLVTTFLTKFGATEESDN